MNTKCLEKLVQQYTAEEGKNKACTSDPEIVYFKGFLTLESLIEKIWTLPDGKRHFHQRRLSSSVLEKVKSNLLVSIPSIKRCKTFEEIRGIVEECSERGFGELGKYDTSYRLGMWRDINIMPEKVYLHSGTRQGAKALGLNVSRDSISVMEFPAPLDRLTAYQLEDFLCHYKDEIKNCSE